MENYVLIFTYYWPPASSGGVWRFLKTVKYLPQYNWTPIVVTVKNGAFTAIDETLIAEIPENLELYKTKCYDPYTIYNFLQGKKGKNLPEAMSGVIEGNSIFQKISMFIRSNFFIPDPKIGWVPTSVKKGKKIIKSKSIKAIITTGPPHSTHIIGRKLKKKFNIPWIIDFRDPWTSNYMVTELMKRTRLVRNIDKRLENRAISLADCVTGISPGLINEFKSRSKRSEIIYNGFDEDDFKAYQKKPQDKFVFSYIGSLKPNQNIIALWEAISELKGEIDGFEDNFILEFVGNLNPFIIKEIERLGLKDQLRLTNFIPHETAIKKMQDSSLLLFIVPRAEYSKSITSGKIFEYIASKTSILSIGPTDGDITWILEKAKREKIIDYDDKASIKKSLKYKYEEWHKNGKIIPQIDSDDYLYFSRKGQAKQFADLLNTLSKK